MIGAVVVTHKGLAQGLLSAVAMIMGDAGGICSVSVEPEDQPEDLTARVQEAVKQASPGRQGVLILTDMFGGTPTNIGMSFLEPGKVEVVTGVNLPMLIKFMTHRDTDDVGRLGRLLRDEGKHAIYLASEMLEGADDL